MTLRCVEDTGVSSHTTSECSWCGPGECFCPDGPQAPLEDHTDPQESPAERYPYLPDEAQSDEPVRQP